MNSENQRPSEPASVEADSSPRASAQPVGGGRTEKARLPGETRTAEMAEPFVVTGGGVGKYRGGARASTREGDVQLEHGFTSCSVLAAPVSLTPGELVSKASALKRILWESC